MCKELKERDNAISFVIIVKDDLHGLKDTLGTIVTQLIGDDEIIVVDGSSDESIAQYIKSDCYEVTSIKLIRDSGRGVFLAQNMGIKSALRPWVWVVNSGDRLLSGARRLVSEEIKQDSVITIHVFSQIAFSKKNNIQYLFTPTDKTLWPHQSVIVNAGVHYRYGYYEETFKYGGEQLFFARVRRTEPFKIYKMPISEYLLGGLSAQYNFCHAAEIFQVHRELGHGLVWSIAKAYPLPIMKIFFEKIFGDQFAQVLKTVIFRYYEQLK